VAIGQEIDYGIDAPGVVRKLLAGGVAALAGAIIAAHFQLPEPISEIAAIAGAAWLAAAGLMLAYAKYGKFGQRDRMLAMVDWRGDESVLDIGTGHGLLLIGAAKRLTSGRATGIDIWNPGDLSDNTREHAQFNLTAEGLTDRCALYSMPAEAMTFPDASFDVVLSNLCLHNIAAKTNRDRACFHIARVLKPGGVAVISDLRNVRSYAENLHHAGLSVKIGPRTFPPLRILCAQKPVECNPRAASDGGRQETPVARPTATRETE
jgi:arsenite methyltransferase